MINNTIEDLENFIRLYAINGQHSEDIGFVGMRCLEIVGALVLTRETRQLDQFLTTSDRAVFRRFLPHLVDFVELFAATVTQWNQENTELDESREPSARAAHTEIMDSADSGNGDRDDAQELLTLSMEYEALDVLADLLCDRSRIHLAMAGLDHLNGLYVTEMSGDDRTRENLNGWLSHIDNVLQSPESLVNLTDVLQLPLIDNLRGIFQVSNNIPQDTPWWLGSVLEKTASFKLLVEASVLLRAMEVEIEAMLQKVIQEFNSRNDWYLRPIVFNSDGTATCPTLSGVQISFKDSEGFIDICSWPYYPPVKLVGIAASEISIAMEEITWSWAGDSSNSPFPIRHRVRPHEDNWNEVEEQVLDSLAAAGPKSTGQPSEVLKWNFGCHAGDCRIDYRFDSRESVLECRLESRQVSVFRYEFSIFSLNGSKTPYRDEVILKFQDQRHVGYFSIALDPEDFEESNTFMLHVKEVPALGRHQVDAFQSISESPDNNGNLLIALDEELSKHGKWKYAFVVTPLSRSKTAPTITMSSDSEYVLLEAILLEQLKRMATKYLKNPGRSGDGSQDALQDAFISLMRPEVISRLMDSSKKNRDNYLSLCRRYMMKTIRNKVSDEIRRQRKSSVHDELHAFLTLPPDSSELDRLILLDQLENHLDQLVSQLGDQDQLVLKQRRQGKSHNEIARALGENVTTVRKRFSRITARLREQFDSGNLNFDKALVAQSLAKYRHEDFRPWEEISEAEKDKYLDEAEFEISRIDVDEVLSSI